MSLKASPNRPSGRPGLWQTVLILGLVVAALFWRSWLPGQVMFANDAPLGLLSCHKEFFLDTFTGTWTDINWVGSQAPGALPNLSALVFYLAGPVGMVKFNAAFALFVLGLSGWFALRQFGLGALASLLGGLAFALNSSAFSNACWGLPAWAYARAMALVALGLLAKTQGSGWARAALAGGALGLGVADGFDSGAIFSLYVAAFVVFQALATPGRSVPQMGRGIARVGVVAICAMLVAAQVLITLVGTQIKGVEGTRQDRESKEQRWDFATQWSLPKVEALRVLIPGLFGYRMDTPDGGAYWGTVGQQPGWEEHHQGIVRYSGSGEYAGVLVVLLAALAVANSWRKQGSPYAGEEKRMIWFWAAAALVSLLFAFGRHAPFYHLVYRLPYFSTVRNPIKWMQPFQVAIGILFGYGLEALARMYLGRLAGPRAALRDQLNAWWAAAAGFEKKWFAGLGAVLALSLLGLLVFSSSRPDLVRYLQATGFNAEVSASLVSFSTGEIGWYLFFLTLSSVVLVLIACGSLAGARARLAWVCLGVLLVTDLARANSPWLIYYDYRHKYAANPVIDILKEKPYEHRVKILPFQVNEAMALIQNLYQIEWLQHLFPYHNIQSLDIPQEPRVAADNAAYRAAFRGTNAALILREWELTNTRYLIGLSGELVNFLNQRFDPEKKRFRLHTAFEVEPKPTAPRQPQLEDLTAVIKPDGHFALIEFTGALPRAGLYAQWQVATNDEAALQRLADLSFDPHQSVLVAEPIPPSAATNGLTTANPGTVAFKNYTPKYIQLTAQTEQAAVLLLNDKYDPQWKVWVDGQPQPLLRCNFLMRGVQLAPGQHTVEFRFQPPETALYVSLGTLGAGLLLGLFLLVTNGRTPADQRHEPSRDVSK